MTAGRSELATFPVRSRIPETERRGVGGPGGPGLSPGGLALLDRALAVCPLATGARVLDVGCGQAEAVAYLRRRCGLRAFGLDLAPGLAGPAAASGLPVVQADGEHLPIRLAQLDAVLCECTLSLLPGPAPALRGFHDVLRPGGWLLLSDVYARPLTGALSAAPAGRAGALSRPELEAELSGAGFQTLLWEDHTSALKTFLGRTIFQRGALPAAWRAVTAGAAARLGYFLLVARRA